MSETQNQERSDRPGKTRTWWHPLLARLMDHLLATAYTVQEEDFAMQHTETQYLVPLEEELLTAVLQVAPVEKRLEGLSPEERVQGLSPEDRLRGLSAEELAAGLTEEQAGQLRKLLQRKCGN